jgi:hypothetical protein
MTRRKYEKNEVDAILARAIESDNQWGELSHEDLIAAAREVGISSAALEKAATEVLAERRERAELLVIRREQWRGFFRHLVPYVMVNGLLVTINYLTTHFPWALFPALAWGIGLIMHLMAVVHPDPQRLQRKLQRRRDRERRQALKEQIRANARLLEQDVGEGISAVLQAVARRIEGPGSTSRDAQARVRVSSAAASPREDEEEQPERTSVSAKPRGRE